MKYPIKNTLEEKILCHEIRGTQHNGHDVLLHFFIVQEEHSLPQFKLACETYKTTSTSFLNKEYDDETTPLVSSFLINPSDEATVIFEDYTDSQYNSFTGEKSDTLSDLSTSSGSANNVSINTDLRYISEMEDNSIYHENIQEQRDKSQKEIAQRQEQLKSTFQKEIDTNEYRTNHSVWNSKFHFTKFQKCSESELISLFFKYKPYIDLKIPTHLESDSHISIDMVSIFGMSFDILRIKNSLFSDDDIDTNVSY